MRLPKYILGKHVLLIALLFFVNGMLLAKPENSSEKLVALKNTLRKSENEKSADKWLGKDKFQHFFVSGFLTAYGYAFLHQAIKSPENTSVYVSSVGVAALGVGKEIYDLKSKKGQPSFKDILADLLGIGTAFLFVKVL